MARSCWICHADGGPGFRVGAGLSVPAARMRRAGGGPAAPGGGHEEPAEWTGQIASHAAAAAHAAAASGKTAGAVSVDRAGAVAALDARKNILLVKLSADGLPVHKSLRHKDAGRWVVGTNVCWCHAEQHSQLLASTCNSVAFIWNATAIHPIYALREHKRSVNAICWHPTDGTIATCSADSYIHVWDVRTPPRRPDMSFCAWTSGATCIEWSLGDENVLASSHDNEVRLWDRRKGTLSQPTAFITAHRHNVRSLAWRPGMAKGLLTLGQDGVVKLWDTDEPRECKADLEKQIPYSVQLASWAPFGDGLVTAGDSGDVTLWSLPQHSSGSRWFDEAAAGGLDHVATLSDQARQTKLRDFAWREHAPANRYQLCSLSVTGDLHTQSIAADWMARCGHVKNKASVPSSRGQADVYSRDRTADRHPSNRHELKKAVDWELTTLEESAALAGRLKFDRYTESGDRLTARLRIEARKPMQTQNARNPRSVEAGHIVVDMTFPENYPTGHRVAPIFVFNTSTLWSGSGSVALSLTNALEKKVAELANASVAKQSLCMDKCIHASVEILDGPLGTGQSGNRSDGVGDSKANADQRERKGYTPCPVLSAGLFSGPGYFVTFNNGLPFVLDGRRAAAAGLAGGAAGTSSPPSPPSPPPRIQSPLRHVSITTPPVTPAAAAGHMDDSPTLMSPTVAHSNANGIAACKLATMKREYRSFLQELGRPLQDASKPNLSAMIVGAAATVDSSATNEYDVPPTPEQMRLSSGSSAGFSYQDIRSRTSASSRIDGVGALSAWNAVKVMDRSYVDIGLAKNYTSMLVDVDCPPRECCKRNAVHAENYGLVEVAQTW